MLLANKKEVDEVAQLLVNGADNPTDLAKRVIKRLTELREERKVYALVFGLAGKAHLGFGPFATIDQAFGSVEKNPVAYIAQRGAIVPIIGSSQTGAMSALADAPPADNTMFTLTREDALAFKNGWRGRVADRDRYLNA